MSKGFIYVLTNPGMDGLVKIGRSIHSGQKRAEQLDGTGLPFPFDVHFQIYIDDHERFEREIHGELDSLRVNEKREFFRLCPEVATDQILSLYASWREYDLEASDFHVGSDSILEAHKVLEEELNYGSDGAHELAHAISHVIVRSPGLCRSMIDNRREWIKEHGFKYKSEPHLKAVS